MSEAFRVLVAVAVAIGIVGLVVVSVCVIAVSLTWRRDWCDHIWDEPDDGQDQLKQE